MMARLFRKMKWMLTFALAAVMMLMLCVPAFAADAGAKTYKVRIYSGRSGEINNGKTNLVWEKEYSYREVMNEFHPQADVTAGSKYYVKGIRESGRDNEEAVASPAFVVTHDVDYVVAYGIKGELVAYTVNYLDDEGNELLESETFYGNVGDQPVIAFRYVEGWQPQAYNLTKTLSADESENVFNFEYTRVEGAGAAGGAGAGEAGAAGTGAAGAGGAGAAGAGAAGAGAGAGGVAVPDEATPQDLVNLDDEETPLANIGNGIRSLVDPDGDGILVNIPKPLIGVGLAVIAFLAVLIAMLSRKKKKEKITNE